MSKQHVIIQGNLALAVTRYTEKGNSISILPGDLQKALSAPRGVYLHPRQIKIVGTYTIIEQREKS